MSNLVPPTTADLCTSEAPPAPAIEAFAARSTELGRGLIIRRALPLRQRRLVGPWCFFDHYGPLAFTANKPMDVAPHPHIGLQTVSWLIEGEVLHSDSLDNQCIIRPGELNLMTAGYGVAHSEETPPQNSGRLHGVQLWIALPDAHRNTSPAFEHYAMLPMVDFPSVCATVIIGELAGERSPAKTYSPVVGVDLAVRAGAQFVLPLNPGFEHALMVLDGELLFEGQRGTPDVLYYLGTHRDELAVASHQGARALLIGGAPFGETVLMWWNFVARTREEIAAAREDWEEQHRFGEVKAYRGARLAAPP